MATNTLYKTMKVIQDCEGGWDEQQEQRQRQSQTDCHQVRDWAAFVLGLDIGWPPSDVAGTPSDVAGSPSDVAETLGAVGGTLGGVGGTSCTVGETSSDVGETLGGVSGPFEDEGPPVLGDGAGEGPGTRKF